MYTACVCSSIELQLGSYIHTCTNETHSLALLQDLILILTKTTFIAIHHDTKGLNLVEVLENVFHLCMYVCSNPTAILEQTHAVYNAAWVVSDSYIASYLFPYFLCQSLLSLLNLNDKIVSYYDDYIKITNCTSCTLTTPVMVTSLPLAAMDKGSHQSKCQSHIPLCNDHKQYYNYHQHIHLHKLYITHNTLYIIVVYGMASHH